MPDRRRDNARGIAAMCAAMAAFTFNDALVKVASAELPLGQIIALRGVVACTLLAALLIARRELHTLRRLAHPAVGARLVGEVGATIFYLTGLVRMPFNNAIAAFQVTPLATTAAAAIFLRERVRWRRWLAITVGFVGALAIIRPTGTGFTAASLFILVAVLFVVLRDISTARMPPEIPTFAVAGSAAFAVMLMGFVIAAADRLGGGDGFRAMSLPLGLVLAAAGVFLLVGYVFIVIAMRAGEFSVVAPFRYTIIVWAFLVGTLWFRESLDSWTLVGTALIVGSGVYTFYREQIVRRR